MTRKGVWNLQQTRDKYLQSLWANDVHMYGWGYNVDGTQGTNTTGNPAPGGSGPSIVASSPIQIGTDANWNSFNGKAGYYSAYFVVTTKTDGTLWSWGRNDHGTLGHNNETKYSSPTQIGSGTDWSSVTSYGNKAVTAVKTDGTLWMWGANAYGILGQNESYGPSKQGISSPVQIPGTTWSKAYVGAYSTAATKTNGQLWMWGYNNQGQLGQNSILSSPAFGGYSSPVQVPGTTWSKATTGSTHTLAIKTDGTLWAWGAGTAGPLGQNQPNNAHYSSPVQIPGTNWSDTWTTQVRSAAINTDGELFIWGANVNGCLGQNQSQSNYDNASSPIQIAGTTWDKFSWLVYGGWSATKTDGTLWGCGRLNYGAKLHETVPSDGVSSPIQLGSDSTWDSITSWGYGMTALRSTLTPSQL